MSGLPVTVLVAVYVIHIVIVNISSATINIWTKTAATIFLAIIFAAKKLLTWKSCDFLSAIIAAAAQPSSISIGEIQSQNAAVNYQLSAEHLQAIAVDDSNCFLEHYLSAYIVISKITHYFVLQLRHMLDGRQKLRYRRT